ncbi:unnamed protein product [Mycena citricolor]|uniref:Integrase core domain-containing protein n=1 Tax=Mycena citricolor TaxID=2018698 RepID=A0AAD2GWT4_9AGAR|nr:unnamed protein product [Mycena citricolor]
MGNQHKPTPSKTPELQSAIEYYWKMKRNDKFILEQLKKHHIDLSRYGLEIKAFRKIREHFGFFRVRKQGHTVETIGDAVARIRVIYPKAGGRDMVNLLFNEENMMVSSGIVMEFFHRFEPDLVRERCHGHFKRKQFWAAGVNNLWAVDQHDKWKYKFGLALHTGIDPFIGYIHWMKIWWNNSNPCLILSYYLDAIQELQFIPLVSQSDPGSETVRIANGHTTLRHLHDPNLAGTSQHRYMRKKKNVMPEITWSMMRRRFTPGFENILDEGVNNGWYDTGNLLQALVFRWVFIRWLQAELEGYQNRVNMTAKRQDRNKILPHGVPQHMLEYPEEYAVLDFKIKVQQQHIDAVRQEYASPDHDIFNLVPPDFDALISGFYQEIGKPAVNRETCWEIYHQLLDRFEHLEEIHNMESNVDELWGFALIQAEDQYLNEIQPILNLRPLWGDEDIVGFYVGGVNGGEGLDDGHQAHLQQLVNDVEPNVPGAAGNNDNDNEVVQAWFSDEEGPEDLAAADEW